MTTLARARDEELVDDGPALAPDDVGPDVADASPAPRRRVSAAAGVAAATAVAAGTWAVAGSILVLPFLSVNRDETVYLLQADALREGFLFPPAPEPAESFTPWFAVESGGRFILKYTPVHAATLALGRMLLGSERATIALAAAAVVFLTFLLGCEVLGNRKQAAGAAVLLAVSPLFLIQSITFLSYVGNLALLLGFAVAFLRGVRTRARWLLVAGGFALGLAFFARPFDAVLFGGPIAAWFLLAHLRQWPVVVRTAAWTLLGAAPPLIATFLFNRVATGSALEFPFSVLEPLDTIGFGPRRLQPTDPVYDYDLSEAITALKGYGSLITLWVGGGLLTLGLSLPGLRRSHGPLRGIAAIALAVPAGYFFFWGPANLIWMSRYLGPFYYLPMLVPLSILGVRGLAALARWSRPLGVAAVVAMIACSGSFTERVVRENVRQTSIPAAVIEPFRGTALRDAVVFLPGVTLLNPFGFARNDPSFDGDVIWSLDREEENFDVLDRFPDRVPYSLQLPAVFGGEVEAGQDQRLQLEEMQRLRSPQIEWAVSALNRAPLPVVALEVSFDDATPEVLVVDDRSRVGKTLEGTLVVGRDGVGFVRAGQRATVRSSPLPAAEGTITVSFTASDAKRSSVRPLGTMTVPYRVVEGNLEVLVAKGSSGAIAEPRAVGASS